MGAFMPEPMPALEIDDATELTRATWLFLEREMAQLNKPLLGPVQTMAEFLAEANDEKNATSLDDRLAIIKQAELLLNDLYPHLPFKLEKFRLDHPREFLQ